MHVANASTRGGGGGAVAHSDCRTRSRRQIRDANAADDRRPITRGSDGDCDSVRDGGLYPRLSRSMYDAIGSRFDGRRLRVGTQWLDGRSRRRRPSRSITGLECNEPEPQQESRPRVTHRDRQPIRLPAVRRERQCNLVVRAVDLDVSCRLLEAVRRRSHRVLAVLEGRELDRPVVADVFLVGFAGG